MDEADGMIAGNVTCFAGKISKDEGEMINFTPRYEQEIADLKSRNTQLENACHAYDLEVAELMQRVRTLEKTNAELVTACVEAVAALIGSMNAEAPRKPTFSGRVMSRNEVAGLLRDG